jgi:hypothetical protein
MIDISKARYWWKRAAFGEAYSECFLPGDLYGNPIVGTKVFLGVEMDCYATDPQGIILTLCDQLAAEHARAERLAAYVRADTRGRKANGEAFRAKEPCELADADARWDNALRERLNAEAALLPGDTEPHP